MLKKVLVITVITVFSVLVFQGAAFAASGQIVLEDTLYGAAIGGVLGGAWYLLDEDNLSAKLGTSIAIGAIAGFFLGITDVSGIVWIDGDEIGIGLPPIIIEESEAGVRYRTNLVNVRF